MKKVWLFVAAGAALLAGGTVATVTLVQALGAGADRTLFSKTLFGIVSRVLPQVPLAGRVLIVAQAALESGWGKLSNARASTNNLWNITAGSSWQGPVAAGSDTDGAGKPISQRWRSYPNVEAAVTDYWQFLGNLYPGAREVISTTGDPYEYAHQLKLGKVGAYYSAPEADYAGQVASVRATVAQALMVNV